MASFSQYTYYNTAATLGGMQEATRSFRLARGYMATFTAESNGSGSSKVYVAQDHDLDISFLPGELDNAVRFVRSLPWRWVAKKGTSDPGADPLDAAWRYNWNNNLESTLDWQYVPIRQQRYWPGLPTSKQNVTAVLGFNEPDNPVEDAYQTLGDGSVDAAIAYWPQMLSTGHRVGSPAVTDGGRAWLYEFMDKAIAANLRVDYIAIQTTRPTTRQHRSPTGSRRSTTATSSRSGSRNSTMEPIGRRPQTPRPNRTPPGSPASRRCSTPLPGSSGIPSVRTSRTCGR